MLPRVRIGSGTLHCTAPLHIVRSLRIVPVPLLSCVAVFVVGGEVWWGNCASLSSSPFTVCVLCHSIVGLGLCLCDRVMSLWNSGDGLCWVEGRVASTVYCPLLTLHVLWCVFQCGVCGVLLRCVVGCGMAVGGVSVRVCGLVVCLLCLLLFFFLLCWCSG